MMELLRIALISCGKSKRKGIHRAQDMYTSHLFQSALAYAMKSYPIIFILSAKHGLLHPDKCIRDYDISLARMPKKSRKAWSHKIAKQLLATVPPGFEIHFFSGKLYREDVIPLLSGRTCVVPLQGLSIGRQLKWYKERLPPKTKRRRP